jgi:hypothetical protein
MKCVSPPNASTIGRLGAWRGALDDCADGDDADVAGALAAGACDDRDPGAAGRAECSPPHPATSAPSVTAAARTDQDRSMGTGRP